MTVILHAEPTASAPALWLRPWRPDDADALLAAHRDPLLRHRLTTPLATGAQARRWIDAQSAGWETGSRFSFAVLGHDAGTPIGHVVVKVTGLEDPSCSSTAEVGYWTSAGVRGRGVAGRALETVSRWALGSQRIVPLVRLDLLHAVDNHASCRVADKCGYVLQSVLPAQPPVFPHEGHLHVRAA
ncbi:putative acetyltransferase [Planotetraspora thailandica]|uniref:Putative acetyltransferase n=1 Tax=Planotetraspora thailandica TaxID=487172 RepID=A0A8J3V2S0_9ACTN|nr:GNAT family N-acetyltransferase [Planotetraspora thailandica]GII56297.1 putative acetyltransferase [Planotetraspora thailandica]